MIDIGRSWSFVGVVVGCCSYVMPGVAQKRTDPFWKATPLYRGCSRSLAMLVFVCDGLGALFTLAIVVTCLKMRASAHPRTPN